ncbi:MAG: hypothetical protein ACOCV2_08615 [Persicimonas sp.]
MHEGFRHPPLFPEEVIGAIADRDAVLTGDFGAGEDTQRAEGGAESYDATARVDAVGESPRQFGQYEFRSCASLFARIEARSEPRQAGAAPWQIEVTPLSIRYDGSAIFTRSCLDRFQCAHEHKSEEVRLDSLVGPVLSYRVISMTSPCEAVPYGHPDFYTIDLRDGSAADLTALVQPKSLLSALKEDTWVKEHVSEERLDEVESLEALLGDSPMTQFQHYSFYDWDPDRQKVAVRIWKPHIGGKWSGSFPFIGLWVSPRPEFREYFEAADDERGFYMTSERRPVF